MKCAKLMLGTLVAIAASASAMPTPEQIRVAERVVGELMGDDQAALKSGRKTRAEVAGSAMALVGTAESNAEKLVLMKGAYSLYVRAGEFDKAVETLRSLRTTIPDIPPSYMVTIIEDSLRGTPRRDDARLTRILDATRTLARYSSEVAELVRALRKTPGDQTLRRSQAEHHACLGKWDLALENFAAVEGRAGEIAKAERDGSVDAAAAADFWWSYASGKAKELEKCLRAHAAEYYEKAIISGTITDLNKLLAERRIAETKKNDDLYVVSRDEPVITAWDVASNAKYKFNYRLDDGGNATLIGSPCVSPKPEGVLVVPDKIDGHTVTKIDNMAFRGCNKMTRIVLPAHLEGIQNHWCGISNPGAIFDGCFALKSIEIAESNPRYTSEKGVLYTKNKKCLIVYPKTRSEITLARETTEVGVGAFNSCTFKTAKIPDAIGSIGYWAFRDCQNLEIVEFPKSTKWIGAYIFESSLKMKKVVFHDDAPVAYARRTRGRQNLFHSSSKNIVVEVKKGSKGWQSKDSAELPERWPTVGSDSRPIRYIQ